MHRGQQYLLHLIVSVFIAINVGLIFVMNVPYSLNIFSTDPYYVGILDQYKYP